MSEATLGRANIIIGAALDQLDKDLEGAKSRVSSALEGIAKITAGIVVAGFAALAGGLAAAVGEAMSAQEALSQLDAVLKSTGGAAGVTHDQAVALAGAWQDVSRYSDEAVIGAENMLLTFTNIGQKVFPDALGVTLDMASAMGSDLKSASILVGKALNDPINGLSSLTRVGVTFTDEQKKMITAMAEAGDVAGAQALIMAELQKEFGGSAVAAGETFAGQLDRLKNKFSDILETVGFAVMPMLQSLADKLMTWLSDPQVQAQIDNFIAGLVSWVEYIVNNVLPVIFQVGQAIIEGIGAAVTWLSENQGVVVGVLGIIAAGFLVWGANAAIAAASTLIALAPVILVIGAIGLAVGLLYTAWTENWGGIQEKVEKAWDAIRPIFELLGSVIKSVWEGTIKPALQEFAVRISEWWEKIAPQVEAAWNKIWEVITVVAGEIAKFIQTHMDAIKGIFESVWGVIEGVFNTAWAIIRGIVETALLIFQDDWGAAWDRIKLMFSQVWDALQGILTSAWNALTGVFKLAWAAFGGEIKSAWDAIKGWFEEAWGKVTGFLSSIDLGQIGADIVATLWQGLKDTWQSVVDWWNENVAPIFGAQPPGGTNSMNGMATPSQYASLNGSLPTRTAGGYPEARVGNEWTVNIYANQSTGRVLDDLMVAQALLGGA